jgi:hypothetical protein
MLGKNLFPISVTPVYGPCTWTDSLAERREMYVYKLLVRKPGGKSFLEELGVDGR